MTYKQIKWMILIIPTVTVGIWEYVRHQFLLPYISMDFGNWLTPVIVFLVSVTLLQRLFSILEKMQQELQVERSANAALEAREYLAKELHDGISQSLFLLNVKVDKLENASEPAEQRKDLFQIRKTVHEVNRYVRQAIANLRFPVTLEEGDSNGGTLEQQIDQIAEEVTIPIEVNWIIPDEAFNSKEKVELLACIREAVVNIQKHTQAAKGWIKGEGGMQEWEVMIIDDGEGFEADPFSMKDHYGLHIMKERASEMNWGLSIWRENNRTILELSKQDRRGEKIYDKD